MKTLPSTFNTPLESELLGFYDEIADGIRNGAILGNVRELFTRMEGWRRASSSTQWEKIIQLTGNHPLIHLLHEDPLTRRAFEKPRGYAGDAFMLDYIYRPDPTWNRPAGISPIGQAIYNYTCNAPAAAGVRRRAQITASLIDRLADDINKPDILAIACGHLRVSGMNGALRQGKIGRWVAMDGDANSVEIVERETAHLGVETACARVKDVLTGKFEPGTFDFIYSTGLYDYLDLKVGSALLKKLFGMLKPRGKLLTANYMQGIPDRGYMETFMAWNLIYRTRQDLMDLALSLEQDDLADIRIGVEDSKHIGFLEVNRRG